MTPFPAKFRRLPLINVTIRLVNQGFFRGNTLQIGLLSSSLWLAIQTSSGAFFSPAPREHQFAGNIYQAMAPNANETPPQTDIYRAMAPNANEAALRTLEKKGKKPVDKHFNPFNSLNLSSAQPLLLSQSSSVQEELDVFESKIDSPVATEQPWEQNSAAPNPDDSGGNQPIDAGQSLDLSPELIESSPVLQRWLEEIPDLLSDIAHDPSFRTRFRVGYSEFPSTDQRRGVNFGVEDVFIDRTGLTLSGDYHRNGEGDRQSYGVDLRYYLFPLGSYFNVAPVVGYRYLQTGSFNTDGINLGIRLFVAPSRTGAADISLTQTWVSPTRSEEVGITILSLGYAVTHNLRISTDIQAQNSPLKHDSRVGISLEWML